MPPDLSVWYVGDSTTDTVAAKNAGITSVFFNGAQWDQVWLNTIFPGTERHPHKPDVVVNDFSEFWAMTLACLGQSWALRPRRGAAAVAARRGGAASPASGAAS